ncbi:MAG TPA: hypothetical protein VM802_08015 [Chitinophaga sp.]|uniref:hypothetical protein n=1 Tax=Chitinophaga sp. TaxID=1869181 RepID=UPI002C91008B|nr:hypothetical protein [Chitinophaga sp.]HVI44800.1 hypothetical protein [Chitinophaga sp.]
MKEIILEKLLDDCMNSNTQTATLLLEKLIDRHTRQLYNDDYTEAFRHHEELLPLQLDTRDIFHIRNFLFYLLLNHPDKAAPAASCLVRCYDKTIWTSICQAIELYYLKDDQATCHLTDAITYSGSFEEFGDHILSLFRKLEKEGLPATRKLMAVKFAYYRKFYNFEG